VSAETPRRSLEPWFAIREVANALGVSVSTVRRFIKHGKIRAVKTGHLWRISESALNEFLRANQHVVEDQETQVGEGS